MRPPRLVHPSAAIGGREFADDALALLVARFWTKVAVGGPNDCWEWTAAKTKGYGRFFLERSPPPRPGVRGRGHMILAHRFAYELLQGPIPDGLQIDHLCRKRACVNPAHLEPVTPAVNVRRAAAVITACPKGHPYDEANTRISNGSRRCRECSVEWGLTRTRRRRLAAA